MMKPKTRQEMLRLVESIREKLDLTLILVASREADASQQREPKGDLAIKTFREESQKGGSCLARRHGGNRGLPGGTRKQVSPPTLTIGGRRPVSANATGRRNPSTLEGGSPTWTAHTPSVSKRRHARWFLVAARGPGYSRPASARRGGRMVRQRSSGSVAYLTTMIYTHVLNRGPAAVRSPADRILGS